LPKVENGLVSRVKKVLFTATAVASLTALAIVLYRYGVRTPSDDTSVHSSEKLAPPPSAEFTPSPKPRFSFTLLDQPHPLPELRFGDGDGRVLTFTDFRRKTVLLNIWATWCAPCIREMPALDRLQAKLAGPDFEVVALSIDYGGLPAVKDFYQKFGLKSLGIYVDKTAKARRDLNIVGIPTTLLVDRNGQEVGRTTGPEEWDHPDVVKFIRQYLNE
jgi:thiol-disulfide isomerase/thioredoxin